MELNEVVKGKVINKGLNIIRERVSNICNNMDNNTLSLNEHLDSIKIHAIVKLLECNETLRDLEATFEEISEFTEDDDLNNIIEQSQHYEALNEMLGDVLAGILKDLIGNTGWKRLIAESLLDEE